MRLRHVGRHAARTGVAWCAVGRIAGAQVAGIAVDPHMVVLTAGHTAGQITVLNPHDTRASFSVDLRFGFATTDSAGKLIVELRDGPDSASAAGWVVAYPARFTLRPGAMRTVRLLAQPPDGTPDGEYWARLTVHARDDADTILSDTTDRSAVRVRIAMETATVLPVFFRKGIVTTGVTVGAAQASASGNAVEVRAALTRHGSAAFLGIAHIVVRDANGRTIGAVDRQLAVYRSMQPRWTVPVESGAALVGSSVTLRFATDRRDVPENLLVRARAVETIIPVMPAVAP